MAQIKALNIKPVSSPAVSTRNLTLPKNSVKVGLGVKPQHVSKVNWGKTKTLKQKGSSQL